MKEVSWVFSALKDLKTFPKKVQNTIGYALHEIQIGKKPYNVKPLTGLGHGVMEVVADYDNNTYRGVYTINIGDKIYVLHCFQKKSKKGIETPKTEIDLIKERIKWLNVYLKEK